MSVPWYAEMRKASVLALAVLSAACASIMPTPNDFPPPPATPIFKFPLGTAQPTFAPRPRSMPILSDDMADARTFFLITKVAVATGDAQLVAERILYPIHLKVHEQTLIIHSEAEFLESYGQIFVSAMRETLAPTDEQDLVVFSEGIRVGSGTLRFNLFCSDPACAQTEFLITQVSN